MLKPRKPILNGVRAGCVCEVKTDGRLDRFGPARGLKMNLQNEIRARLQRPREALALAGGRFAGLPAQEESLGGHRRARRVEAGEAQARLLFITAARLGCAIEADEGVMHGA